MSEGYARYANIVPPPVQDPQIGSQTISTTE
jgi:hypothetical protein